MNRGQLTVDDSIFNNYHFLRFWCFNECGSTCVWISNVQCSVHENWKRTRTSYLSLNVIPCHCHQLKCIHDIEYIEYGIDWMSLWNINITKSHSSTGSNSMNTNNMIMILCEIYWWCINDRIHMRLINNIEWAMARLIFHWYRYPDDHYYFVLWGTDESIPGIEFIKQFQSFHIKLWHSFLK